MTAVRFLRWISAYKQQLVHKRPPMMSWSAVCSIVPGQVCWWRAVALSRAELSIAENGIQL